MIKIEKQKEKFANHKAVFTDLGNIKILDFKNPSSSEYRIRFLFEEDYYRLHISGDLGELTASNYCNMTFDGFKDFANNPGYFEEKVDCHSRVFYRYDAEKAVEEILDFFGGQNEMNDIVLCMTSRRGTDAVDDFLNDVLENFDSKTGLSDDGFKLLSELTDDSYSLYASHFGREKTGIIELYLTAFNMAIEQLTNKGSDS